MSKLRVHIYIVTALIAGVISILTAYQAKLYKVEDEELEWMNFMWISDSLGNKYFDRAYIYLPVKIQGIPHDFTFQFDLGLNVTSVYKPSIRPYLTSYPTVEQKLDTTSEFHYLKQMDLMIDGYKFENKSVLLLNDDRNVLTVDSVQNNTVKHIGSIGVDLFQDKVLIIDYPNERIAVSENIPSDMASRATFVNMSLDKRGRPVLPMKIKGKERKVMFDTGASSFQLFTVPQSWKEVTSGQIADSVLVSTFGDEYYMYGAETDDIYLGEQKLPTAMCYKSDYQIGFMKENDIWGITGNAYFWNDIVVVDFVNKKFGVIKQ